jgi:peptidoglycan/xylan/chitin deacetylase (PgdA/CDA1 family)
MLLIGMWWVLQLGISARAETPTSFSVAITIDDLPWARVEQGPVDEAPSVATSRLLDALRQRGVVATGYVNCDRVASGAPVLRQWLAAGMSLGNHQAAHDNINKVPEEQWLAGVRRCHRGLTDVMG